VALPRRRNAGRGSRLEPIPGFPLSWRLNDVVPRGGTSIQCLRLGMTNYSFFNRLFYFGQQW
jgi:hypothetical protein